MEHFKPGKSSPITDQFFKELMKLAYGDTLTYEYIKKQYGLDIQDETQPYRGYMLSAIRRSENHGRAWITDVNIGYRRATEKEKVEIVLRKARNTTRKKERRAEKVWSQTDVETLPLDTQRLWTYEGMVLRMSLRLKDATTKVRALEFIKKQPTPLEIPFEKLTEIYLRKKENA